jgi:hypothetical protein
VKTATALSPAKNMSVCGETIGRKVSCWVSDADCNPFSWFKFQAAMTSDYIGIADGYLTLRKLSGTGCRALGVVRGKWRGAQNKTRRGVRLSDTDARNANFIFCTCLSPNKTSVD